MNNFHDFFFGMSTQQRDTYATRIGTSIHYLERIAGGFCLPSLRMARRLVKASRGKTSYEAIIKTWEAKHGPI